MGKYSDQQKRRYDGVFNIKKIELKRNVKVGDAFVNILYHL